MKKYLATSLTVLLLGVVVVVSSSNGQDNKKKKKKEKGSMQISMTENDTVVNGKRFRDLSAAEKAEFEKKTAELKINHEKMSRELEQEMKQLNRDMQKLNSEMLLLNDSLLSEFEFDDDDKSVRIYRHKAPKAPRAPRFPEYSEAPPMPDMPEIPRFEFNFDGEGKYSIVSDEEKEGMQVFMFNDGNKKTVIKLMKATEKDLKKIGAKKDEEIKMFPNPAKDQLSLSFNFSEATPVTINIYTNDGKLVKSETIKDYKGGNYEKMYTLNEFENGIYLVEFVQKELKIVRKLSVVR
jgi:Secretion system C-terminal sorting domain